MDLGSRHAGTTHGGCRVGCVGAEISEAVLQLEGKRGTTPAVRDIGKLLLQSRHSGVGDEE